MLNRSVMIVTPAAPYLAWAKSLESADEPETPVEPWTTAYLIPELDADEDPDRNLRRVFPSVFGRMLLDWSSDERQWPQRRTLDMFKKWFTFTMHSTVEDICEYELHDDENDA